MLFILGVPDTGNTLILRRMKGKGATYTVITYYMLGVLAEGNTLINYEENIPPASFVLKLEEYYYSTGNKRQGD